MNGKKNIAHTSGPGSAEPPHPSAPGYARLRVPLALASGLLAAACSSAPPPPPPKPVVAKPPPAKVATPEEQLASANKKFESQDFEGALKGYDQVLAKQPDATVVQYNKAVALHRLGRLDEAATAYEAVLAKNPDDKQAALNLGAVLKARGAPGDVDKAIKFYTKALEKDPFEPNLLNNLSVLYREKGKHKEAVAALRKLLMRDQKNIDAYKNLALVYFDQKKLKLTQTILENAQKLAQEQNKKDPDIFVNLGMVYLAREENGKAMAAFKKALDVDPNNLPANYNIGALALGHRDYGLAARSYEVVAKAQPGNYYVAASLGYSYQGLQEPAKASEWLEKARKLKEQGTATAGAEGAPVGAEEEAQMILQLMRIKRAAEDWDGAKKYGQEYLRVKNLTCGAEDYDGFCGEINGIDLMIQAAKEAAAAPPPEETKPKATGNVDSVFTDGPAEGEAVEGEGAPVDGEAPPADGAEAPPAEGETPAGGGEGGAS